MTAVALSLSCVAMAGIGMPCAKETCSAGPWAGERILPGTASFRVEHVGNGLMVWDGPAPILVYNYGLKLAPGVAEDRRRACYIHPLYGPDGEVLTADFPKDHPHHRGLYWAWPKVYVGPEMRRTDMWHLKGMWTRFEQWLGFEQSPHCAIIGLRNGWYDDTQTRHVQEDVWMRIWPAQRLGRCIDFDITLTAQQMPITLEGQTGKGYGGFLYRPARANDVRIATDSAPLITGKDSDLSRSTWADFSASFGSADAPQESPRSGVAIFPAPDHPAYPPPWITRHYGYLGISWPGLEQHTLLPVGDPLRLRYRVYIHRGDWESGQVRETCERYLAECKR